MKSDTSTWPVWIIVAILGLGALATRSPLKSPRPEGQHLPSTLYPVEQTVGARLWQDPLWTVSEAEKTNRGHPPTSGSSEQNVQLLIVLVPGGPYSFDGEQRSRMRYATAMALLDQSYTPDDADHLGYWRPESKANTWTTIAYEWWTLSGQRRAAAKKDANEHAGRTLTPREQGNLRTLVMWVSEDDLIAGQALKISDDSPPPIAPALQAGGATTGFSKSLRTSGSVCSRLHLLMKGLDNPSRLSITSLYVLGPFSSDGLISVAKSGKSFAKNVISTLPSLGNDAVHFISPTATISKHRVASRLPDSLLARTICTDDDLAGVLLDELGARGVIDKDSACHEGRNPLADVVLISEYDSAYGRNWPKSFETEAGKKLKCRGKCGCPTECKCASGCKVQKYFYLRGLDGFKGSEPGSQSSTTPSHDADNVLRRLLSSKLPSEQPAGSAQLDYARRLAGAIEQSQTAGSPIKAIGICGSDVFDKLLLLQALRDSFPGRVFFTTDMDASLLMPDQYRWTRNLIVASAFDLRLGTELQGKAPPFRDCYQTSLYIAAKRMLAQSAPSGSDDSAPQRLRTLRLPPAPRVYEIGRSGARDLALPLGGMSNDPCFPGAPIPTAWLVRCWPLLLGGLSVLLCLAVYFHHTGFGSTARLLVRPSNRPVRGRWSDIRFELSQLGRSLLICLCILLAAGALGVLFYKGMRKFTFPEPLAVFEGLSVWPTEAIRLVGSLLAIWYCSVLLRRWGKETCRTRQRFNIPPYQWGSTPPNGLFSIGWRKPEGPVDFAMLWDGYRLRGTWHVRLARALFFSVLFFIGGIGVFAGFHMPPNPIRGDFAWWVDWLARYSSVFTMLWLNFLVWDAARLATRFIRLLTSEDYTTRYPAEMTSPIPRLDPTVAPALLDTRIASRLTESIAPAIYYPLFILFLMLMARSQVFDNWQLGFPLVLVLVGSFLITFLSAISLRRAAEDCRKIELKRLQRQLDSLGIPLPSATAATPESPARMPRDAILATEYQRAIVEISGNTSGAFRRFRENPVLRPLLVPASGGIALLLLDYFSSRF